MDFKHFSESVGIIFIYIKNKILLLNYLIVFKFIMTGN